MSMFYCKATCARCRKTRVCAWLGPVFDKTPDKGGWRCRRCCGIKRGSKV